MDRSVPKFSRVAGFIYSGYARLAMVVVPTIGILALLIPTLMTDVDEMAKAYHSQFADELAKIVEKSTKLNAPSIDDLIVVPVNPLLSIADTVRKEPSKDLSNNYHYVVRSDLIMMVIGIVFILYMMQTYFARFNRQDQEISSDQSRNSEHITSNHDVTCAKGNTQAALALSEGVKITAGRASEVFARSTIMLFSGIIFATIGIFVFAFTMTPGSEDDRFTRRYLEESMYLSDKVARIYEEIVRLSDDKNKDVIENLRTTIAKLDDRLSTFEHPSNTSIAALILKFFMGNSRALGMLFFVETIAWFLLRQYRSLVEDYKWFYRLYIKRQNYLVAFLISDGITNSKDARALVANALINEDLSGRMLAGTTTEALENLKLVDQNPIMAMTQLLAGQLGYVMSPAGSGDKRRKLFSKHKDNGISGQSVSNSVNGRALPVG